MLLEGLEEGLHKFYVRSYDNYENNRTEIISFTVDLTTPELEASIDDCALFGLADTVITGSISDALSGVDSARYKFDEGEETPIADPADFELSLDGLGEGDHTLTVWALDKVGNEVEEIFPFIIDRLLPVISINLEDGQAFSDTKPDFFLEVDGGLAEMNSAFYQLDYEDEVYFTNFGGHYFELANLSPGHHILKIFAVDNAGNEILREIPFIVDTTDPTVDIDLIDGEAFSSTDLEFTISTSGGLSGMESVHYQLDAGNQMILDGDTISLAGLSQGEHTLTIIAVDKAGNMITEPLTFIVDTLDPTIDIDFASGDAFGTEDVTFSFTVDSGPSGMKYAQYQLDAGVPIPISELDDSMSFTNLGEGTHSLKIVIVDNAGNEMEETLSFTIDLTKPVLDINFNDGDAFSSEDVDFTFSLADGLSGVESCYYQLDDGTKVYIDTFENVALSFKELSEGDHSLKIVALDKAGNEITEDLTFIIDLTDPNLTIDESDLDVDRSEMSLSWEATDANGIRGYAYRYNDGVEWSEWSEEFTDSSLTLDLPDGDYTLEVKAIDNAGNYAVEDITFAVDTVPPVLSIDSVDWINEESYRIEWTVNDDRTGVDFLEYSLDGVNWVDAGQDVSVTTVLQKGAQHILHVHAYDKAGNVMEKTVSVSVHDGYVLVYFDPVEEYSSNDSPVMSWSGTNDGVPIEEYQFRLEIYDAASESWLSYEGQEWSAITDVTEVQFNELDDGMYRFSIRFEDNGQEVTISVEFTVDTIAPTLVLDSGSNAVESGYITGFPDTIPWSVGDDVSGISHLEYRLNGGKWNRLDHTASSLALSEEEFPPGTYELVLRVYDRAGNMVEKTLSFTVDLAKPSLEIDLNNNDIFAEKDVDIILTVSDDVSGVKSCTYELNEGSPVSLQDLSEFKLELKNLNSGSHHLKITAIDNAGNKMEAVFNFVVDITPPTLDLPESKVVKDSDVLISWTGADEGGSGIRGYAYSFDDGATWSGESTDTSFTLYSLQDGIYTLKVRAYDKAGHYVTEELILTVDTALPTFELSLEDGVILSDGNVELTLTVDGGFSGIKAVDSKLDEGGWTGHSNSESITLSFSDLEGGSHSLNVRVTDKAGNVRLGTFSFTVDLSPPALNINFNDGDAFSSGDVNVIFTVVDSLSGVESCYYQLDDGAKVNVHIFENVALNFRGLSEGTYTLKLVAFDTVGNKMEETLEFKVDLTPPTLDVCFESGGIFTGNELEITLTTGGGLSGVGSVEYQLDDDDPVSVAGNTISLIGLDDGEYSLTILVKDKAGNEMAETFSFIVDNTAPNLVLPQENLIIDGSQVSLTWADDDGEGSGIRGYEYSLDGGTNWSDEFTDPALSLSDLEDGVYTLSVKAYDLAGNSAVKQMPFTIDTVPPELSIDLVHWDADEGEHIISWESSDDGGSGVAHYEYSLDGGKTWVTVAGTESGVSLPLGDGQYDLLVRAYDHSGNSAEEKMSLTVSGSYVLMHLEPVGDFTSETSVTMDWAGTNGSAEVDSYQYRLMKLNPDSGEYELYDGSGWGEPGTAVSKAYEGLTDGQYRFEIGVLDGEGELIVAPMEFTVDTAEPTLDINLEEDDAFSDTAVEFNLTIDGGVSEIESVEYQLDDGDWIPIHDFEDFTLRLDELSEGTHTLKIRASDKVGNKLEEEISFKIDLSDPTLTFDEEDLEVDGSQVSMSWAGDDDDGIRGYKYRLNEGEWSEEVSESSIVLADVPDGKHVLEVMAIDRAGNYVVEEFEFVVDNSPPTMEIDFQDGEAFGENDLDVVLTIDGGLSGMDYWKYKLDDGDWILLDNFYLVPLSFEALIEGEHTLTIVAVDTSGNEMLEEMSFIVDLSPPTLTIDFDDEQIFADSDVDIVFTVNGGHSGVESCYYQLDDGAEIYVDSFEDVALRFEDLTEGDHTLKIVAIDKAGNDMVTEMSFVVDFTLPVLTIDFSNGDAFSETEVEFTLSIDGGISGIDSARYRLNDGDWVSILDFDDYVLVFTGLEEKVHNLRIEALDKAGNEMVKELSFKIDLTEPTLTFDEEDLKVDGSQVSMSWAGNDDDGIRGYRYRLNDGEWSEEISDEDLSLLVPDGNHVLEVMAIDRAGNSVVESISFTVDTTPPVLDIDLTDGKAFSTAEVEFTLSVDDGLSGIEEYYYQLDDGVRVDIDVFEDYVLNLQDLSEGEHTLTIVAIDDGRNRMEESISFIIDLSDPVLTIDLQDGEAFAEGDVEFTFSIDGGLSGVESGYYQLNEEAPVNIDNFEDYVLSFTGLGEGTHSLKIVALDKAGNELDAELSFIVDTTPPDLSIDPGYWDETEGKYVIKWADEDDGGSGIAHVEYNVDGQGWEDAGSEGSMSMDLEDGSHQLQVRVYDEAGNMVEKTVTVIVSGGNVLTYFDPVEEISNGNSPSMSWAGTSDGEEIDDYSYLLEKLNPETGEYEPYDGQDWSAPGPGTSASYEDLPDGEYRFSIRVGEGEEALILGSMDFIADTSDPSFEISFKDGDSFPDTSLEFTLDIDGGVSGMDYWQYQLDSGDWVTMDGLDLSLTELSDGIHSLRIAVVDKAGNRMEEELSFRVDISDPTLTLLQEDLEVDGSQVSVSWAGYDNDGIRGYRYRLNDGEWSEEISDEDLSLLVPDGNHVLEVMAIDRAGNSVVEELSFRVDTTPPVLEISFEDGAYLGESDTHVTLSLIDLSDITSCRYQIDDGPWFDVDSFEAFQLSLEGLGEGEHTLKIFAKDANGHETEEELSFTIDRTVPTLDVSGDNLEVEGLNVSLSWSGDDDIDIRGYQYRLNDGEWSEEFTESVLSLSGLKPGNYVMEVKVYDLAGNYVVEEIRFTIETPFSLWIFFFLVFSLIALMASLRMTYLI